jgi:hypothetical protein
MLPIDETFLLLPNQSLSIEYKQISFVFNMKIWLIIHFITTCLIEILLLAPCLMLFFWTVTLFYYSYFERIGDFMESNWLYICHLDRCSLLIIVLKKEMKLIFVYVCIAFLYTWFELVNTNRTLTYLNFLRWFIEASLIPLILIFTVFQYCFVYIMDFFELYHIFYVSMIVVKVLLFVLMRYAESHSDFVINRFQMLLFNVFSYWLSK